MKLGNKERRSLRLRTDIQRFEEFTLALHTTQLTEQELIASFAKRYSVTEKTMRSLLQRERRRRSLES